MKNMKFGTREYMFNHEKHENSRKRTNTLHHEGHEVNEAKPGSAGRLTGFKAFRLWRPTPRRWITPGGPPVASN